MGSPLHFEAPTALQYFAALVADDASFSVLEAAIAVAQDDDPGLDPQAVLSEIDTLAERLRRRLPADAAPLQRLRLLNRYFFQELGFAGNVNDYYDARNSYLPAGAAQRGAASRSRWRCCTSSSRRRSAWARPACRSRGISWSSCTCRAAR